MKQYRCASLITLLLGGLIAAIACCMHGPEDGCVCRKPAAGLLEQAAESLGRIPAMSLLIGDRASDLQAARTFGCEAWLVRSGHGRHTERRLGAGDAQAVFDDLGSAADAILAMR